MTAKKKPTISGIMKQERITTKARNLCYKHEDTLVDMKNRIEEGIVETIDGVTYVVVKKPGMYGTGRVVEFIPLKK